MALEDRLRMLYKDTETTTIQVKHLIGEAHTPHTATTPVTQSAPPIFHTILTVPNPNISACQRLSKRAFTSDEVGDLIEAVFSSPEGSYEINCLGEDDAQTFVDVIYEACPRFAHHREIQLIEDMPF